MLFDYIIVIFPNFPFLHFVLLLFLFFNLPMMQLYFIRNRPYRLLNSEYYILSIKIKIQLILRSVFSNQIFTLNYIYCLNTNQTTD